MKNIHFLLMMLVVVVLACAIFIPMIPHENSELENKLEAKNDSLKTVNETLQLRFKSDSVKIDSLVKVSNVVKEKIVYLKNKQNEKVRIISALNNDELFKYFAEFNPTDSIK